MDFLSILLVLAPLLTIFIFILAILKSRQTGKLKLDRATALAQ